MSVGKTRRLRAVTAVAVAAAASIALAVPAAATGARAPRHDAAIIIHVGGDRVADSAPGVRGGVTGLAGVEFSVSSSTGVVGTCTSLEDGTCTVGNLAPGDYTVTQVGSPPNAPAGWFSNPGFGVGSAPLPPATQPTPANTLSVTVGASDVDVPLPAGNELPLTNRSGTWALSRENPPHPTRCGLRIALLFDLSSSITSTLLPQYISAGQDFVRALEGTPSEVAVYTFGTGAPAENTTDDNNNTLPLTPVALPEGENSAATVIDKIGGLRVPANSFTNWDQGLWQIANSDVAKGPDPYDLAIMLTDGDPTKFGPNGVGGLPIPARTRFAEVENGIFSANALKLTGTTAPATRAKGTTILGVGIADNISPGSVANLRAVTGTVPNQDFFTTDFAHLGDLLTRIGEENCLGTVNITKLVVPGSNPDGDLSGAEPAPGWTFSVPELSEQSPMTTPGSGTVSFDTGARTEPITVQETPMAGYTPLPDATTCRNTRTGQDVTPTPLPSGGGFTVRPDPNGSISCEVFNKAPDEEQPASVVVNKTWVINGVSVPEGEQDADFQATPSITPLPENVEQPTWGQTVDGYFAGDRVTIGEPALRIPPNCTGSSSSEDFGTHTLESGENVFHVTNTVTCQPPGIRIVKSASPPTFSAAGQTITYSFRVTNTSNVPLDPVTVRDTRLGDIACPQTALAAAGEPGASMICTVTYTTTQADVNAGRIRNTATATGIPPEGVSPGEVTDQDSAVVTAMPPKPPPTTPPPTTPTTPTPTTPPPSKPAVLPEVPVTG